MRITLLFLLITTLINCQDEIIFMDGIILKGEVDKKSIVENPSSIRFKPQGLQKYSFSIAFIRLFSNFSLGEVDNAPLQRVAEIFIFPLVS